MQGSFGFNDHQQISSIRYFSPGSSTDVLNLVYDYTSGVPGNNGQIQAVHYLASPGMENPARSEFFTYDQTSRLAEAHTGDNSWDLRWAYDRFGNRLAQQLVQGTASINQSELTVDASTNHLIDPRIGYDAAGDQTSDGTNVYGFDGAGRLVSVNSGAAIYTYFGQLRIKKVTGTTSTIYVYSDGKTIAEYVNGAISEQYVYNPAGRLLATINASGTLRYHHPDHLSNRAEQILSEP